MPERASVAELTRLGQFVKEKHISLDWLGAELGVSASTVSRWCWGKQGMSEEMVSRVVEVLDRRARDQEPPMGLLDDQMPQSGKGLRKARLMPYDRALRDLRTGASV